ncbi:MAG: isopenicillin N synthase family dioxygenase [Acidimicrobiales bacterium]
MTVAAEVLDVDLLAFERGDGAARRAAVDGVLRSLGTGFVTTSHDVPEDLLDEAYGMLAAFFALPASVKGRWVAPRSHGQTGYTGLLVETAAGADQADWKEMLNWSTDLDPAHPLRRRYPAQYHDQVLPDGDVPGIAKVLTTFHRRILDLQRRFLRIVAVGLGCRESFFDDLLADGTTLTRAIHYPPMATAPEPGHIWAAPHTDINLITALPRASGPGLQLLTSDGWADIAAPPGRMIINSGIMLERLTNGRIPAGLHRVVAPEGPGPVGDRYSVVQFCHPAPWFVLGPLASCVTAERPLRYGAIEAGALLERVLWDINLVPHAPQ